MISFIRIAVKTATIFIFIDINVHTYGIIPKNSFFFKKEFLENTTKTPYIQVLNGRLCQTSLKSIVFRLRLYITITSLVERAFLLGSIQCKAHCFSVVRAGLNTPRRCKSTNRKFRRPIFQSFTDFVQSRRRLSDLWFDFIGQQAAT